MSKFNVDYGHVGDCFGKAQKIAEEIERLGKMVDGVRGDMRDALVGCESLGTLVSNLGTQIGNRVKKLTEFSDIGKKVMQLYEMTEGDNLVRVMRNDPSALFGINSIMSNMGGLSNLGFILQMTSNPGAIGRQLFGPRGTGTTTITSSSNTETIMDEGVTFPGLEVKGDGAIPGSKTATGVGYVKNRLNMETEGAESRVSIEIDNSAAKHTSEFILSDDGKGHVKKIVVTTKGGEVSGRITGSAVNGGKNLTRGTYGLSFNKGSVDCAYVEEFADGGSYKVGVNPQLGVGMLYGAGQDSKGGGITVTGGPVTVYGEYTNSPQESASYLQRQAEREALNNRVLESQQRGSEPTLQSSLFNAMDNDRI